MYNLIKYRANIDQDNVMILSLSIMQYEMRKIKSIELISNLYAEN